MEGTRRPAVIPVESYSTVPYLHGTLLEDFMTAIVKRIAKWICLGLCGAFLVAQFIRPTWNISGEPPTANITHSFPVPIEVETLLRRSCYDCHSNNTRYPWYSQIQPVGWWLQSHIDDAKRQVNFDEFASYRPMRQYKKLQEMAEQVDEDLMPLPSYLFVHRDARLSEEEKTVLTSWTGEMRDSMRVWFPPDSLQRPQRQQ